VPNYSYIAAIGKDEGLPTSRFLKNSIQKPPKRLKFLEDSRIPLGFVCTPFGRRTGDEQDPPEFSVMDKTLVEQLVCKRCGGLPVMFGNLDKNK
jgi:hypothetical protein